MKVCFVVNELSFFLSHRLDLAETIAKDYEFFVVTDSLKATNEEIINLKKRGIKLIKLRQRSKLFGLRDYLRYLLELRRAIKKISPEYIFFITLEISMFGAFIHNFTGGKKSFFIITGIGHYLTSTNLKVLIFRTLNRISYFFLTLKKDHLFIFQNHDDQRLFINKKMTFSNKTVVIRGNGVDGSFFKYVDRGVPDEIVFLFSSRLLVSKGVKEFISASIILKEKYSNISFIIAGKFDPSIPETISEDLFDEICKSEKYFGEISYTKMPSVYKKASVFVLPSYREGLPKAALEAGLTGLPLILTDVPGCRDCITSNKNGFLIEPRNVKDLVEKMELFIKNPSSILEKGKYSREYILQNFNNEVIGKEYLKIIKERN